VSAKSEAFIKINATCPICERETVNRYVKSKMFTPLEMDGDRFVKTYRWELPQYEGLRPTYYHVWHCPHCHFCEEKEVFRGEDDLSGKIDLLKDKLLIEMRRPNNIMATLGEHIDFYAERVSWGSALAAHILAIHIQELLSPNTRLSGKLARLYLRTAWLYREMTIPEIAEVQETSQPELEALLCKWQESWPDGPFSEEAAIEKAISYYKQELDQAGRVDDVRHEVGIMFLIIALYLREGNRRGAMDYVQMIFRGCTQKRVATKRAIDAGVKKGKIPAKRLEAMKSLVQWLNNTIERITALSEKLTHEIFEEEYPRAREVVLTMQEATPEEVLKKLREEEFFEGTCRKVANLVKKKLVANKLENLDEAEAAAAEKARAEKKKGFFGKLMGSLKPEDNA
jgi:uncharacterized protein (DUF2225 family)